MSKLRVVVCNSGELPVEREIEHSLESLQAIVGGSLQLVPLAGGGRLRGLDVFVNEEGRYLELPFNRVVGGHVILGPILVSKANARGDQIPLTPDDVASAIAALGAEQVAIVDAEGALLAVRARGQWLCPYGGTFTARELRNLDALVAGEIDAASLGLRVHRTPTIASPVTS